MKKLFFLPLLLAAGFVQGQITLDQSDFASVGDTVFLATDETISGTNVGTAGASAQTWNFANFGIESFDTLLFVTPSSAVGGTDFPTANVALVTGATSTFFNKSAAGVQILGNGGGFGGLGFSAPYNPPYNILSFPATLGATINATSGFDVTEYIGLDTTIDFPPLVSNLQVLLDSIRFKRESVIDVTFDAHGNVTLPIDTYPALRAYNVQTNNDTIFAFMGAPVSIPFLLTLNAGWNVITAQMAQSISLLAPGLLLGQTTGISTARSYDWYAKDIGYRLVSVELDTAAGHAPKRVQYLSDPSLMSIADDELLPNAYVYPNPANAFLMLKGIDAATQGNITVTDMFGRAVMNVRYNGQNQLSLEGLANGTYFLRFNDDKGKLLFTDRFQVVK